MFLCVCLQFRRRCPCQWIIKTVIISSISAITKLLSIWAADWLLKAWTNHLWWYRVLHEFLFRIHCCFSLIMSLVIIKSRGYTWLKGFLSCLGFCFQDKANLNEIVIQSCQNELAATFQTFWLSSREFTNRWTSLAPCHCQQGLKTLFQTLFQRQEQVFITWCLLWSYQQSSELWEISLVQASRLSGSPHRDHTKYSLERLCRLDEFWQKPALTLLQSPQVSNSGQACTFWDSARLLSSSPRVVSKHLKAAKKQEAREKDAQVTDFSSVAPKSQHQPEWQA